MFRAINIAESLKLLITRVVGGAAVHPETSSTFQNTLLILELNLFDFTDSITE